jgi:hypothetical protein
MMTRTTLSRHSKVRAKQAIAAMADMAQIYDQDEAIYSQSSNLILRFPRDIWNASDPDALTETIRVAKPTHPSEPTVPCSKVGAKKKTGTKAQQFPRGRISKCKSNLYRFHYGGTQRRVTGKNRNHIELEQPCLAPTCPTCQYWHPHLLKTDEEGDSAFGSAEENSWREEPRSVEITLPTPPNSPEPELRLDVAWVVEGSVPHVEPRLQLLGTCRPPVPLECVDPRLLRPQCDVYRVPEQTVRPSISTKSQWDTTPCNYPLALKPQQPKELTPGPEKFTNLKGILKHRQKANAGSDSSAMKKKVRFRYRVRCVFSSAQGREKFRRAVECL